MFLCAFDLRFSCKLCLQMNVQYMQVWVCENKLTQKQDSAAVPIETQVKVDLVVAVMMRAAQRVMPALYPAGSLGCSGVYTP